jgi:hypothetical protein
MTAPTSSRTGAGAGRTAFALWLDAILLLLFLLIESPRITGVAAHEWVGFAILVPIIVHLLLSWHWIATKAKWMWTKGNPRTRINYLINVVLFGSMIVAIVSGGIVSRVAMPQLGIATVFDLDRFELHDGSSNVLFAAIVLHLAMNWGWVLAALRKRSFTAEELEANEDDEEPGAEVSRG